MAPPLFFWFRSPAYSFTQVTGLDQYWSRPPMLAHRTSVVNARGQALGDPVGAERRPGAGASADLASFRRPPQPRGGLDEDG